MIMSRGKGRNAKPLSTREELNAIRNKRLPRITHPTMKVQERRQKPSKSTNQSVALIEINILHNLTAIDHNRRGICTRKRMNPLRRSGSRFSHMGKAMLSSKGSG